MSGTLPASSPCACAAAAASGAPAPFRGPVADSVLGERFLDVIALVSANGFALDARPTRYLCGLTFRLGARRADGSLDRAGFAGGPADVIKRALEEQAPWLQAARRAPREDTSEMPEWPGFEAVERTTSLIRASMAGNLRRVRELLAAGAPLRCADDTGSIALHWAIQRGSVRVVAALLEADAAGETVNAQDGVGNTPLVLASLYSCEGAVRALLARGALLELQNYRGKTALHCAAYQIRIDVVELLCAAPGAATALALRDHWGNTPLVLALENDFVACAALLRAHGAPE